MLLQTKKKRMTERYAQSYTELLPKCKSRVRVFERGRENINLSFTFSLVSSTQLIHITVIQLLKYYEIHISIYHSLSHTQLIRSTFLYYS